jgi:hypothetical protein
VALCAVLTVALGLAGDSRPGVQAQAPVPQLPPGDPGEAAFAQQAKALAALLDPDRKATVEPLPAGKDAATLLKELMVARRDTARQEVQARFQEFEAGRGTLDIMLEGVLRLEKAELQLTDDPKQQYTAHDRSYQLLKLVEQVNQLRYEAGRISVQDLMQSRFARLDAEIDRLRARQRMEGKLVPPPGR